MAPVIANAALQWTDSNMLGRGCCLLAITVVEANICHKLIRTSFPLQISTGILCTIIVIVTTFITCFLITIFTLFRYGFLKFELVVIVRLAKTKRKFQYCYCKIFGRSNTLTCKSVWFKVLLFISCDWNCHLSQVHFRQEVLQDKSFRQELQSLLILKLSEVKYCHWQIYEDALPS